MPQPRQKAGLSHLTGNDLWHGEYWQVLLVWVNHNQESILSNQPFAFYIYKFKVVGLRFRWIKVFQFDLNAGYSVFISIINIYFCNTVQSKFYFPIPISFFQ